MSKPEAREFAPKLQKWTKIELLRNHDMYSTTEQPELPRIELVRDSMLPNGSRTQDFVQHIYNYDRAVKNQKTLGKIRGAPKGRLTASREMTRYLARGVELGITLAHLALGAAQPVGVNEEQYEAHATVLTRRFVDVEPELLSVGDMISETLGFMYFIRSALEVEDVRQAVMYHRDFSDRQASMVLGALTDLGVLAKPGIPELELRFPHISRIEV